MGNILETENFPVALKGFSSEELVVLCSEMREFLVDLLSERGGHVGPNLGIIEASVALHKVFNSPYDKIVWDVSHQSLPHKILTGRIGLVRKFHQTGGASPFTNIYESEHDHFSVGHTSTSVSLAAGLAKARDFRVADSRSASSNDAPRENVIAVIGDGSLSGGQAFEGLNVGGSLKSGFIVLVNDNEMSIDFNAGGLYTGLARLRASKGQDPCNIFKFLGYDYLYVEGGNDVNALVEAFESVKDTTHPVVVHIHTKKGLGIKWAEENPELWHYHIPFDKTTGENVVSHDKKRPLVVSSTEATINFLRDNEDVLTVIPGSPLLGRALQDSISDRYLDMGIAEATGISFSSALAKGLAIDSANAPTKGHDTQPPGAITSPAKKVFICIASTFLQRAYDQVIQDWTLNDTPATLVVLGGAITATDSAHIGVFDIPMLKNIPNLVYLTPASEREYLQMLHWCKKQSFPTAIRVSGGNIPAFEDRSSPPIEAGFTGADVSVVGETISGGVTPRREFVAKSEVVHRGKDVAILGLGMFLHKALEVRDILLEYGINSTVINPRFISHLDTELLESLTKDHRLVVSLEDGSTNGGFGESVAHFYEDIRARAESADKGMHVMIRGSFKEHIDSVKYSNLMKRYRLDPETIGSDVLNFLKYDNPEKEVQAPKF
jgi:1-deoxy-D-xylulose-5-phosphate synthase